MPSLQLTGMKAYSLTAPLYQQLIDHCLESPEQEVCGLIGVDPDGRQSLYRVHNIAEQPATAFLMEPRSQIQAMRTMRDAEQELQAIYHSHPSTEATPSETDLRLAAYPDVYYLIASLQTEPPTVRAFQISSQRYCELALKVS